MRLLALLLCAALLASCGFRLRGLGLEELTSVYIDANSARQLGNEIRSQLNVMGVAVVNSAESAEYILKLSNERQERKVLAVSSQTGKVVEFELIYSADMSVASADSKSLNKNQLITARHDLSYDEEIVIDKFEEERLLYSELRRRVAANVLKRLQAILK